MSWEAVSPNLVLPVVDIASAEAKITPSLKVIFPPTFISPVVWMLEAVIGISGPENPVGPKYLYTVI